MSHSVILKTTALLALFYGLAFVFIPDQLAYWYRTEPLNTTGLYNAMLFGAALIGVAAMNWLASRATAAETGMVIVFNLVNGTAGFLVALTRQMTPAGANEMSWLNVAIYFVLMCAFAYLQFFQRSVRAPD